jgi:SPP1 family predicted phage head-tail adaptor
MQAGKLRHRLTIQQPDQSEGSAGEMLPRYSTFATVWGSIEPLSGSEGIYGKQEGSESTHKIRIRYHAGITSDFRVLWNGRYFNLTEPPRNPEERNREMELICKEVTSP